MLGRVRSWVSHRRRRGESLSRTLLVHAPARAARIVSDAAYRRYFPKQLGPEWTRFLSTITAPSERPYLVIAVPDTLHTLLPCILLAKRHVRLAVLGNGLRRWEADLVRRQAPFFYEVPAVRGTMVPHGVVLTLLIQSIEGGFGLHDPDLFVFRPGLYSELEPRDGEVAVGAYAVINQKTSLVFPTTHLLALDGAELRRICTKYGINADVYPRTPQHMREPLSRIGLGDHNPPKAYLGYYDALNLVWAAAILEGARFRIVSSPTSDDLVHIGGISYDRANDRLRYVHARFLGLPLARSFQEAYWRRLVGNGMTASKLEAKLVRAGAGSLVDSIDKAVERISGALRSS